MQDIPQKPNDGCRKVERQVSHVITQNIHTGKLTSSESFLFRFRTAVAAVELRRFFAYRTYNTVSIDGLVIHKQSSLYSKVISHTTDRLTPRKLQKDVHLQQ